MKKLLLDYNESEIAEIASNMNMPKYRASQLCKWISSGVDIMDMSDLPQAMRVALNNEYDGMSCEIETKFHSKDGTIKFLLKLRDDNIIECVLLSYKHGLTLCVSTQVGCKMGCTFCASGKAGFVRSLSAGEIVGQIMTVNNYIKKTDSNGRVSNVVMMGIGEPLDNYDNVTKFIKLAHSYCGIGQRSISLSTCGLPNEIRRLADEGYSVNLCLSTHATTDANRAKTMPIARKYKLSEVVSALKYYFEKSGRRVIFEYATIAGENDTNEDAVRLRKLTSSMPAHINIIKLNSIGNGDTGSYNIASAFKDKLIKLGASATVRRSLGDDIGGACGQLKRKYIKEKGNI